jgi:copper oxidase (laccase) domain-containing protein
MEATLREMERLGARTGRIAAAVGPTIGPGAYEVGPEFEARFLAEDPASAPFFDHRGGRPRFDLPGYIASRLARAGVAGAAWTGHCTYADPCRFFSYRRSTHEGAPDYGRMIALIAPE